jgi:hypothetical protein
MSRARIQSDIGKVMHEPSNNARAPLPDVIDIRKMGGDALIPIAIFERYGNHVYEDLILWNVNGKLSFF